MRLWMSSSVAVDTSHGELGVELLPPLPLFELILSSLTELIGLVFLARVFFSSISTTAEI